MKKKEMELQGVLNKCVFSESKELIKVTRRVIYKALTRW